MKKITLQELITYKFPNKLTQKDKEILTGKDFQLKIYSPNYYALLNQSEILNYKQALTAYRYGLARLLAKSTFVHYKGLKLSSADFQRKLYSLDPSLPLYFNIKMSEYFKFEVLYNHFIEKNYSIDSLDSLLFKLFDSKLLVERFKLAIHLIKLSPNYYLLLPTINEKYPFYHYEHGLVSHFNYKKNPLWALWYKHFAQIGQD